MAIRLKKDIDPTQFLLRARRCTGEVLFRTEQGDVLNLKSILSEYIFVAAAADPSFPLHGALECSDPADLAALAEFTEEA